MLMTMGDLKIKIVRWFPDEREVSYYRFTKKDNPAGGVITVPYSKLKYQLDKHATGARVKSAVTIKDDIRLTWK